MAPESIVKTDGGKRRLIINYKGSPYGADLAQYSQVFKDVVEKLQNVDANEIVLSEYYERIYNEEQTRMLKEIASLVSSLESEAVWSPTHLGTTTETKKLSARHDSILKILELLKSDPFRAYLSLINEQKAVSSATSTISDAKGKEDLQVYSKNLASIREGMEKLTLIQKMAAYVSQLGSLPADRGIYHSFFEVAIKPSFIGSRIFFTGTSNLELADQYEVLGTKVYLYKHPDKIEYLYYINPPEYTLPPEKYFLLEKTKELVAGHRPNDVGFLDITQARSYFHKVYSSTISDIAAANKISLTSEEREELATIVSRYTVGYGIMEILLSDRQLTDVYVDSPLGTKPIYLVHSKYGQCQTNIIFSEEEAKSIVSRFRALSGRPFDEAHPILDFDLEDLQTRIAVIGKPLSLDGIAFAYRLHKDTPWTLSQFLDQKMFSPIAAGLLSYFVDAQASMLIVGSRGAGKTSLLQAMMQEIPQNLRIIVQEDTQELPVPVLKREGFSIQRLKTRPPLGNQSDSEISAEDALRTALRLGDSVLIVGEVRSTEAKALYEAMRVGAVGNVVMGTIHGESAYSIWDRVVNDLGVPTTSFKATDFAIVAAPIRFKGSLKRQRRLIEVTEIKKHWDHDPSSENGLLPWMDFDGQNDELKFYENNLEQSEWISRISKTRGISKSQILQEIKSRGESKMFLVELKRKYDLPQIIESNYTIRAHNKYMLMAESQRQQFGNVDYDQLLKEWKDWVSNNLLKEALSSKNSMKI